MKKIIKRLAIGLAVLLVLLAAAPFAFIQFGSESAATDAKMILSVLIGYGVDSPDTATVQQRLQIAEGFYVNLYAANLGNIRFMAVSDAGDLLISRPRSGDVLLLAHDANGDGQADGQRTLISDLVKPHGLALAGGWLYIAESTAVGKIRYNTATAQVEGDYQRIVEGLTDNGNHWTKSIGMGPDGKLYLTAGSTCNVCEEEDKLRATMMRFNTDGTDFEVYATGLRNSAGFDWAPWDQALYATDNGRDLLGNEFPPCELNRITADGFYGWPYINGDGLLDPDFGTGKEALLATAISPAHEFKPHNAPLGMTFLRHTEATGFEKSALAALHGSWNRTERDGYKVVSLHWQADGTIIEKDFLTGFNSQNNVIGRPSDVIEASDGTLYISDDYSGSVYRVSTTELAAGSQTSVATIAPQAAAKVDAKTALAAYSSDELAQKNADGEQLFAQYRCGNCHNPAMATATRSIKKLEQLPQRYSLNELAAFFLTPTPPMPVFPLDESQREALAVHLYQQSLTGQ